MIRGWTSIKHKESGRPYMNMGRLRSFLKDLLLYELRNYIVEPKSTKNNDGDADMALSPNRKLLKM